MSEQYLIKDNFETISNNPPAPPVALCKFCGEIVKWGFHGYFCTCHGAQLYNEL